MKDEVLNETITKQGYPDVPKSAHVYAEVVHWITIAVCVIALFAPLFIISNPQNNLLNPNMIFAKIIQGATTNEIWSISATGAFPGAHYYLQHPAWGDSIAMFAVALGCSVGLWALVSCAALLLSRERERFYGVVSLAFALVIVLSMFGVLHI